MNIIRQSGRLKRKKQKGKVPMRIDAHVHGMDAVRDAEGRLQQPITSSWKTGAITPEERINEHKKRGIDRVVQLDPANVCAETKKLFGDFVIPVPMVRMHLTSPEEIDRILSDGAGGIKFIAPAYSYGDNRYLPLYEVINDHQALAVFHTGFLAHNFFDPGCALGGLDVVDITHMRAAALDRISRALPSLKMLIAHFGNPWWEECWKMIASLKNVYADFSGGTAITRSMKMWKDIFCPNGKLDANAVSKLCFGSDVDYFLPENCFGYTRYIEFYQRFFDELNVPRELQDKVNSENILRLTTKK